MKSSCSFKTKYWSLVRWKSRYNVLQHGDLLEIVWSVAELNAPTLHNISEWAISRLINFDLHGHFSAPGQCHDALLEFSKRLLNLYSNGHKSKQGLRMASWDQTHDDGALAHARSVEEMLCATTFTLVRTLFVHIVLKQPLLMMLQTITSG